MTTLRWLKKLEQLGLAEASWFWPGPLPGWRVKWRTTVSPGARLVGIGSVIWAPGKDVHHAANVGLDGGRLWMVIVPSTFQPLSVAVTVTATE
jgi:hypothetical protein